MEKIEEKTKEKDKENIGKTTIKMNERNEDVPSIN